MQKRKDKSRRKTGSRARGQDNRKGTSHTSAKQVAANRCNALRSTGPRTPEGKRASKLNAIKHGLRANEIVIPGQEDPGEFMELVRGFFDDLKPQGSTESSYVNEIALAEWRLRRARRVELGEIRTLRLESNEQRKIDVFYDTAYEFPDMLPRILLNSTRGIDDLKGAVAGAIKELRTKGTVSRATCAHLDRLFGNLQLNPARMLKVWFPDKTSKAPENSLKESKGSASGPEAADRNNRPVTGPLGVGPTVRSAPGSEGVDPDGKRVPETEEVGPTMRPSGPGDVNLETKPVPGPSGLGPTASPASGSEGVDLDDKRVPETQEVGPTTNSPSGPESADRDNRPVTGPLEVGAIVSSASGSEGVDRDGKRVPGTKEVDPSMSSTSGPEDVNLETKPAPGPSGLGPTASSAFGSEGVDSDKKREPKPGRVDPKLKATALERLNGCLEALELTRQKVAQQEGIRLEIECQLASVPKEPDVERLRRYEIAIKRDRDRAIDKFEALQNRRRSQPGSR